MTTAHRPTYHSAVGGSEQGGNLLWYPSRHYSSKELPAHMLMKTRGKGQGNEDEILAMDFKQILLEREKHNKNQIQKDEPTYFSIKIPKDPALDEFSEGIIKQKKVETTESNPFPQDIDDSFSSDSGSSSSENSSDEDDEDLLKEFEKIKREREEEAKKKEVEKAAKEEKIRNDEILMGNPLLNSNSYSLKRRWTEETVFKNQTKGEPKEKKRFINDTVRSDFHKKFLNKYIL